jgi:hypothetical protein
VTGSGPVSSADVSYFRRRLLAGAELPPAEGPPRQQLRPTQQPPTPLPPAVIQSGHAPLQDASSKAAAAPGAAQLQHEGGSMLRPKPPLMDAPILKRRVPAKNAPPVNDTSPADISTAAGVTLSLPQADAAIKPGAENSLVPGQRSLRPEPGQASHELAMEEPWPGSRQQQPLGARRAHLQGSSGRAIHQAGGVLQATGGLTAPSGSRVLVISFPVPAFQTRRVVLYTAPGAAFEVDAVMLVGYSTKEADESSKGLPDIAPPVIFLYGSAEVTVGIYSPYVDPGAL